MATDKIWFDPAAVGWYWSQPTMGVNILIDLGSVQPVGKVVARFLGGGEQGSLLFPAEFAVAISEDGKTFYQVSSLIKLMPAERNRAGEPGNYYLEEPGTAYTHPFAFPLKVRARYVGLAVKGATDAVFCDEIAVIKGDFTEEQAVAPRPDQRVPFVTEGVLFGPRKPLLAISTNVTTPNYFRLLDCRPSDRRPAGARCVIELPVAVNILPSKISESLVGEDFTVNGAAWRRWRFPMPSKEIPYKELFRQPFFLTLAGALPQDPKAVFYVESEGFEPNRVTVPILPIEIPEVPRNDDAHVSLAWMSESEAIDWPGFFKAWRHLGFNAVSTFPRYWPAGGQPPAEIARWLTEARRQGFKVLYNESPFHMMVNLHKDEPELYGQLPGGPSKKPCPAYKGRFYQEEIKRVGDCFEKSNPDVVFYDIELWYDGGQEAGTCSRCLDWQKKSGKSMAECLVDMGTQMKTDMFNEIQARCIQLGRAMPVLAMYDLRAAEETYQFVHSFGAVYPKWLQWSQPSLYCLNRIGYAHESMKAEFKALDGKKGVIVPWLTAGTYGEADSGTVEALILESFLNGAAGITYYCSTDFDTPLDFQAHARALAILAPYRELLRTGTSCEVPMATEGVLSSAWGNGKDELLLLLGNYGNSRAVRVRPTLPFAAAGVVTDAQTGAALDPALPLEVEVPGRGFRLLHVRAAPPAPAAKKRPWWKLFG
jgi:hypothetical protein